MARPVNTQSLEKRIKISEEKVAQVEKVFDKNTENIIASHNALEERVNSISLELDSQIKKLRVLIAVTAGLFFFLVYSALL